MNFCPESLSCRVSQMHRSIGSAQLLVAGVPCLDFTSCLLADYEQNLERFFDAETGAVREPERNDGSPAFLFSEVTGLAIHDLLQLYALTGNESYITSAERATKWLLGFAWNDGYFRTRYYFEKDAAPSLRLYSFSGGNFFTFDNAICLQGLASLYATARRSELLTAGNQVAERLAHLIRPDGSVPAICRSDGEELLLPRPRWSQQCGSAHAKISEALAEWMEVTGDHRHTEACRRICQYVLRFQQEDGRFVTDRLTNTTQLHPHCYAAEGLLRTGQILNEPHFVNAALKATEWALRRSIRGKIAQDFFGDVPISSGCRTDALAQVLGLGARLISMGQLRSEFWGDLSQVASVLLETRDPDQGFFRYGEYEDGTRATTMSYWTNAFAFQSLLKFVAAWLSMNSNAVILAGGNGSRAWPLAGRSCPKALVAGLLENDSLLKATTSRFLDSGCVQPERIIIVTSRTGLGEARRQLLPMGVLNDHIIAETAPDGAAHALSYAVTKINGNLQPLLFVSMGDDIVEPVSTFGDALVRGALVAWHSPATVVSLGLHTDKWNEHFGHAFYGEEVASRVHSIEKFIEKPSFQEYAEQRERQHAWESGCVISRAEPLMRILERRPAHIRDIARAILEPVDIRKAVSLFSSMVKFADLGVLGPYILYSLKGSRYDHSGNICLSDDSDRIRLVNGEGNIVVSDRLPVSIEGVSGHLIIESSECNTALLVPLSEWAEWSSCVKNLSSQGELQPFLQGGATAAAAAPKSLMIETQGGCAVQSKHGLILAYRTSHLRVERNSSGLTVASLANLVAPFGTT